MAYLKLLLDLFLSFFRIGLFSFGGGYAMIPLIRREIITLHHWLSMPEFVNVVAISQITPGPVAINGATYVGWKLAGVWGSAVATLGVVLPSLLIMVLLERMYHMAKGKGIGWVEGLFAGVRLAVFPMLVVAAYDVLRAGPLDWRGGLLGAAALAACWRGANATGVIVGAGLAGLFIFQ